MGSIELSDKIVTVDMSVTQVGVALSALHVAIKENEAWLEGAQEGTEMYEEVEQFNKTMHDLAHNLATVLGNAANEEAAGK